MKNPPYYHICVYQNVATVVDKNVYFDSELYFDCNNCDDANFNLTSGVYTNGWPGTYTVTWDLTAQDSYGDRFKSIYLKKNGVKIEESRHYSQYSAYTGFVEEQGKLSLDSFTECLPELHF